VAGRRRGLTGGRLSGGQPRSAMLVVVIPAAGELGTAGVGGAVGFPCCSRIRNRFAAPAGGITATTPAARRRRRDFHRCCNRESTAPPTPAVPSSPAAVNHHHQHRDRGCPPESAHQFKPRRATRHHRQPRGFWRSHQNRCREPCGGFGPVAASPSSPYPRAPAPVLPRREQFSRCFSRFAPPRPPVLQGVTRQISAYCSCASLLKSLAAAQSAPRDPGLESSPAALRLRCNLGVRQSFKYASSKPLAAPPAWSQQLAPFPPRASGPRLRPGQA